MNAFQHIGFIVDTAMTLLVIGFVIKMSRKAPAQSGTAPIDTQAVEKSIKRVIEEAEESSSELNRELQKRQRSLEQLLFDLEGVEQRAQRAIAAAEEKISELSRASQVKAVVEPTVQPIRRAEDSTPETVVAETIITTNDSNEVEARVETSNEKITGPVNIFGEPISESKTPEQPLAKRIEIERTPDRDQSQARKNDDEVRARIHKIYDRAKELLTAGKSVMEVSAATKLPAAAVKRIEETIITKPPTASIVARDPRLGALGDMRRGREVV